MTDMTCMLFTGWQWLSSLGLHVCQMTVLVLCRDLRMALPLTESSLMSISQADTTASCRNSCGLIMTRRSKTSSQMRRRPSSGNTHVSRSHFQSAAGRE